MQHLDDHFAYEENGCGRYAAEEVEAYDIQNKFLSQTDDPRRFAFLTPQVPAKIIRRNAKRELSNDLNEKSLRKEKTEKILLATRNQLV